MQSFTFLNHDVECTVPLPSSEAELMPGIPWGDPCALFTPAYWYTQYLMKGLPTQPHSFRIGETFPEEVTVGLLGGYGVPAEIGLAAFRRLRDEGLISNLCANQQILENCLRDPLQIGHRTAIYRFWRQKAIYLAAAYRALATLDFTFEDAIALRNELTVLPGIGLKTASWIVRNWLGSDQVAILDIHIVRAGILTQIFRPDDSVSRHYLKMETTFIQFSHALNIPTSELDALMWDMMRSTPRLIRGLLEQVAAENSPRSTPAMPIRSPMA